jgi:hypothetical protein
MVDIDAEKLQKLIRKRRRELARARRWRMAWQRVAGALASIGGWIL